MGNFKFRNESTLGSPGVRCQGEWRAEIVSGDLTGVDDTVITMSVGLTMCQALFQ